MKTRDVETGDVVMVHGMRIGRVIHKFLSETNEEVFDVELLASGRRVAALENHIVVNLGPNGWSTGKRPAPCWNASDRDEPLR